MPKDYLVIGAFGIGLLVGCNAVQKKPENPVFADAPRRVAAATQVALNEPETTDILPVAATQNSLTLTADEWEHETTEFNASVVATVNGAPIFAADILERWGSPLRETRNKVNGMRPKLNEQQLAKALGEYQAFRKMIIERELKAHIERRLLVELLKADFKPDQLKTIQTQLDKQFEESEIPRLKKELNVATKTELERLLLDRNTTLANVRNSYVNNVMAIQYLKQNIERPVRPDRQDLLKYYREHERDYDVAAWVRWQDIQVSYNKKFTRDDAQKKIAEASNELQRGRDFATVARKFSDGPTAKEGGLWERTTRDSLADKELENRIFQLPIGKFSAVLEGKDCFHIVLVQQREAAGLVPFEQVQSEIEKKLEAERQSENLKQYMQQLYDQAIIETSYKINTQP